MSPGSRQRPEEYSLQRMLRTERGVLSLGPVRAALTTLSAYVFMIKVLHEHAPHALKYAFYDMGYRVGEDLMNVLAGAAENAEESFIYLVETYKQAGYGNMEVVRFDLSKPEARVAGTNLFETEVARSSGVYRTPRCVDHYSRGMFAGFLSSLLKREVVCEEITCQFRGDERCEFLVLPFSE